MKRIHQISALELRNRLEGATNLCVVANGALCPISAKFMADKILVSPFGTPYILFSGESFCFCISYIIEILEKQTNDGSVFVVRCRPDDLQTNAGTVSISIEQAA